jgi:hypothetical protein
MGAHLARGDTGLGLSGWLSRSFELPGAWGAVCPPVSGCGPGDASDTTVLYVDAAGQLKPYFASCRQLAVYNPPDQVKNDWNDLAIGVCASPSGSWKTLWPHMKHYD